MFLYLAGNIVQNRFIVMKLCVVTHCKTEKKFVGQQLSLQPEITKNSKKIINNSNFNKILLKFEILLS